MALPELNEHWSVVHRPATGRVEIVRSQVPFASLDALEASCAELCEWLERLDRVELRMCCDLRQGPGRNDPAFERAIAPFRKRLQGGFSRVAVVVSGPAGRLQVQRLAITDGSNLRCFLSLDEANAYLDG